MPAAVGCEAQGGNTVAEMERPANAIRAVLLDRDGTVAHLSPAKVEARDAALARVLGQESFALTEKLEESAFRELYWRPPPLPPTTLEGESLFWQRWFAVVLKQAGYTENALKAAKELLDEFVFWKLLEPYPDVPPVLRALRRAGLRIGIISDSWPSLELSFREMGLAEYVDTYTSAYLVGCYKSDARIHLSALRSLDVSAGESVFVDDVGEYVAVARQLGMRAFLINRNSPANDPGSAVISTLWPLLEVLSIAPNGDAHVPDHCKSPDPRGLA